jgi:phosphatidylglycerol:prolipoprotein diacylglycerol transferase
MASHGGIVGMAAGTLLFARKRGRSFWVLGDQVAALAPLGVAMGRVANFINGELWGRASEIRWAVFFPKASPVDPEKVPWALGKDYSTVAEPARWVEWVATKSEWYVQQHWRFVPRHPSQLYAAFLEGILPFVVLLLIHPRHRRPALTVGCCFILYGLGRFIDEFWREPDVGQPIFFGWMSKGQLYTIPVFVIGAILLYVTFRRNPRPALYETPPEPKGKGNGKQSKRK